MDVKLLNSIASEYTYHLIGEPPNKNKLYIFLDSIKIWFFFNKKFSKNIFFIMFHVYTLIWHDYMYTHPIVIVEQRDHNLHVLETVKCRSQ